MASKLRTPALVVALIAAVLIILVETGISLRAPAGLFEGLGGRITELKDSFSTLRQGDSSKSGSGVSDFKDLESMMGGESKDLPGLAVAALINIDFLLMATVLLFNLPLILSPRGISQVQGCNSCLLGLVAIFLGLITFLKALVNIFLMISLLLAIPFGTIVYMVQYAAFETGESAAILSTLMFLKCVLVVAIVIAQERFLLNLGFVLLVGTSFLAMIIISFLHSFPPTFLVSITDSVGAILVAILAMVWGVVYLVGGTIGVLVTLKGVLS